MQCENDENFMKYAIMKGKNEDSHRNIYNHDIATTKGENHNKG